MNFFLKYTVAIIMVILFCFDTAYTQDINYDEVNDAAKKEKVASRNKALKKFMKMTQINEVLTSNFPKRKKLKGFDREYKPLLKCAVKFAKKRKGGSAGAQVLADIISSVIEEETLTQDSYLIEQAIDDCYEAYHNLQRGTIKNGIKINASTKVKNFVLSVYSKKAIQCVVRDISVSGYNVIGGTIGTNMTRCLFNNGKVRSYVGLTLGVGYGIGAFISLSKIEYGKDIDLALPGITASTVGPDYSNYAIGPISKIEDGYQQYSSSQSFRNLDYKQANLGLGIELGSAKGKIGIQVLPGKTRWNYLLNKLK
ncbi:MAG: hypothetical protein N4A33_07235 [Bacteriovoracaceae bacterium]|nr:hypothetical protein [Bacteriovoracaceae bacterium]